jgi:hypothetical protein
MALLNFPPDPNPGDRYTIGTITWQWTGTAWIKFNDPNKVFGEVTSTQVIVTSTANSISTQSGALQVAGGVGIGGDLYVAGTIVGPGATALSTATDSLRRGSTGSVVYQIAPGLTGFIDIGATGTFLISDGTTSTFGSTITNTVNAFSTDTGALVISGGVGIGKDLWVGGDFYVQGQRVVTSSTFGAFVSAGTDIRISFATGTNAIIISDIATLQSVTGRGSTTTNRVFFTNGQDSTSTSTGAVVVRGGIGVSGQITSERLRITDTIFDSTKTPVNTVIATPVDSYALTSFRAAKYLIQIDEGTGTNAHFESREIMLLANNTGSVYMVEYALLSTIAVNTSTFTSLGEFSAGVTAPGGVQTVTLYFTANEATDKVVNVLRTAMVP